MAATVYKSFNPQEVVTGCNRKPQLQSLQRLTGCYNLVTTSLEVVTTARLARPWIHVGPVAARAYSLRAPLDEVVTAVLPP